MKKALLALLPVFVASATTYGQEYQIYINEILTSNDCDIEDQEFDHADWFELYFPPGQGTAVLSLVGYYLSDDPDSLDKYQIPELDEGNVFITSNGHQIFWADNDPEEGPAHTNFTFSIEGDQIYLTEPDAVTIVDSLWFGEHAKDVSYGRVCDGCDDWQFFNNTTPDDPNEELPLAPELLYINEVQVINDNTVRDEMDEYDQWIEIYNPNVCPVNLAGYYITNSDNELLYQIPNDDPQHTVVEGESWRLIWCDGQVEQGTNHASFTLDEAGGTIKLTSPDGSSLVDEVTYPAGGTGASWGRQTDGSPTWIDFTTPTPRVTNQLFIIWGEELYINELLADNVADTVDNYLQTEDWFEVYNPNNYDVDLGGYFFTDNPEVPMKWQVPIDNPDSTVVPANGWLLFWCDEDGGGTTSEGWNHVSFKLRNNGEQLIMRTPDGFTVVDEIEWGQQYDDISYGRQTDGSPWWVPFVGTTPEYSNNGAEVSVEESELNEEPLVAYPNPTRGGIIWFSERVSGQLYTMSGVVVSQFRNARQINPENLAPGVYLFVAEDNRSLRIMVQ